MNAPGHHRPAHRRVADQGRLQVRARDLRLQARAADQRLLRRPARGKPVRQRRSARGLDHRRQAALRRHCTRSTRTSSSSSRWPSSLKPSARVRHRVDHGDGERRLNVVVGITGGIAAYKAVGVVRAFVLAGHDVHVVATEAALRFVGKPTLEAISRNPVHTDLYEAVAEVRHVAIGQAADLIVVAPATANTLAKIAAGLAEDLLGNTDARQYRAARRRAGDAHRDVATTRRRWQTWRYCVNAASSSSARGAASSPAATPVLGGCPNRRKSSRSPLAPSGPHDLDGKRILITAGGTREPLDPVRFLGNRSSGKQGVALASAAARRGAEVDTHRRQPGGRCPYGVTVVRGRIRARAGGGDRVGRCRR